MAKKKTKNQAPTPDQLAQKAKEQAILRLPSTYSLVTAERLLARLGVVLSQDKIQYQIQRPQSFYHALMYLPAKHINISLKIDRCRDIQAYGQQKLIHYLFSGEAAKSENERGHSMREAIERDRVHMVEIGKAFMAWEDESYEKKLSVYDEMTERALAWQRTVDDVLMALLTCLDQNQIGINEHFINHAKAHLLESGSRVSLSEVQKENYRTPDPVGIVERTVIYVIEKHSPSDNLTRASVQNMRPTFESLDKKLQADFDSLTGFNHEGNKQVLNDEMEIAKITEGFEQHISKFTKSLFAYYREYATDHSLKVDSNEALEQGVDESIADDYKALHG